MKAPMALGLLLVCAGSGFALTPNDCVFYASYDGGFDATAARGSGQATVKGEIRFVPGIRGQGILVGAPGTGLSYEAKGNLQLEAGTVSVWVKPETWDDTDAAMRFFFAWVEGQPTAPQDGGQFLWLYRFFSRSTYWLVWDSRGYPTVCRQDTKQFEDVFRKGEWVHLAGTWNGDEMRLFIDGKLQGAARVPTRTLLRSPGERFTVGDPNRANAADTVLDELRLFDRALTAPEVAALHEFKLEAPPDQQELTIIRLPGRGRIRADVNALAHKPDETVGLAARVRLLAQGNDRVIQERTRSFPEGQHTQVEFDASGLAVGEYRVMSDLLENGKTLATTEAAVAVNPPPKWLGSKVGISDKAPAPWTPLVVHRGPEGLSVECWGPRRYDFGSSALPDQLHTTGRDILAGPVTLTGAAAGVPLKLQPGPVALGAKTPARVELAGKTQSGVVTASADSFIEYDGLLWMKLKLWAPAGLGVERLTLEIPLRRSAATLMQTGFAYDDAGAVRAWSHRVVGNAQVWLGNEEGGLQVTIPSARYVRNADRNRQIEIIPEQDRVILRLNLIDKPTPLTLGIQYEFGLQLTPVRPKPKGWRSWRITPLEDTPGTRLNPFFTEGWSLGESYPIPKPDFEKMFNQAAANGDLGFLYLQPYCIWPGMPDYADFAAEWRTNLNNAPPAPDPAAPAMTFMGVCPRPHSWSDYFVDTFCDLYQGKYRDMKWGGVYFDVTSTPICDNADHGCGYRDEYGVWQPEQRYLEHREVQRRFYVAMQERWPSKLLVNHESGCLDMMQLSHCHGMVDGEHLTQILPGTGFSYAGILTLERMRAEYMGHNFGFVPIFLPEFTRAGEGQREVMERFLVNPEPPEVMHLLGLLMLHDILPWNAYSNPAPYFHWWAVQDAFGWGDEVEFLPYWKNGEWVKSAPSDPNVVCTIYRRPGTVPAAPQSRKAMFVVMNNTDEDREVTLQPDWARLGVAQPAEGLLDAWAAASYKYPTFDPDPAGKTPTRRPEPVQVTGKDARVPMAAGAALVKVGKRSFRVLVAG